MSTAERHRDAVVWHELECGGYDADLALWHELAAAAAGPILDVGAGTGRVARSLAGAGHEVVALELDPRLVAELARRPVDGLSAVCADARTFELGRRFGLIVVPMQTLQLLGGAAARAGFWRSAAAHMRPGARLAASVVTDVEAFDGPDHELRAEETELDGLRYRSQPVAVRREADRFVLERRREIQGLGTPEAQLDVICLDRVHETELATEARAHGLHPLPALVIAATAEHIGSTVVMFGA